MSWCQSFRLESDRLHCAGLRESNLRKQKVKHWREWLIACALLMEKNRCQWIVALVMSSCLRQEECASLSSDGGTTYVEKFRQHGLRRWEHDWGWKKVQLTWRSDRRYEVRDGSICALRCAQA